MRALVLLLVAAGCGREWVREYDGSVPTRARPGAVLLVRDRLTGRPVPGALVRQHAEWRIGPDGHWAPKGAEARTDAFGMVTFPLPEGSPDAHWAVFAPGYAPTETYGADIADEIDLRPGRTYSGRVLGIDGRPLAGALVEWKVGCAHAPSLASARTDAEGLVRFESVDDGEFVLEDPRGAGDDYLEGVRGPEAGPGVDQVLPGATLRGRVLTRDGRVPAWAVVTGSARAPRARADADGRFELDGLGSSSLAVWWDGGRQEFTDDFAPGIEAILRVGGHAPEPRRVAVRVLVRCADSARPPDPLMIHFDSLADGRRHSSTWDADDPEVRVPLGPCLVSAGFPWSSHVAPRVRVDVRARREVELVLEAQPVVEPSLDGRIVLEDESWPVDESAHLPAAARAWLRVDLGGTPYTFPIGPAEGGVRRADVRLPGAKVIRIPGLEEGLKAELRGVPAWIAPVSEEGDVQRGSAGLGTHAVGERWLQLAHPRRGWALVRLDLPFEAATLEPDCTLTPWPEPVELRVLLDDGTPAVGAFVEILDPDVAPPGCMDLSDETSETDARGIVRLRWLRDGLHLRLRFGDFVPTWARLAGGPPYDVRIGTAAVELDLSGLESPGGVIDGLAWGAAEDVVTLRGLAAGPHTLIVGAEGRRALVYRLVLRRGETRRIVPALPVR